MPIIMGGKPSKTPTPQIVHAQVLDANGKFVGYVLGMEGWGSSEIFVGMNINGRNVILRVGPSGQELLSNRSGLYYDDTQCLNTPYGLKYSTSGLQATVLGVYNGVIRGGRLFTVGDINSPVETITIRASLGADGECSPIATPRPQEGVVPLTELINLDQEFQPPFRMVYGEN